MKYLILHADGMADLACPELGGKTPLQAAATPNLDQIAQRGEMGLLSLKLLLRLLFIPKLTIATPSFLTFLALN